MSETRVKLPAGGFRPRGYQAEFMKHMDAGGKRALLVWPRRSGKDLTVLHQTAKLAAQRPGFYAYGLPTYNQARRVCWQGFLSDGRPLLESVFPREIVAERKEAEMSLRLANGSLIQFIGADTIDRLVGTNPVGVVLSEMALCKPTVFDFIRPILAQNNGWFVGQSTPRSKNHFHKLFETARKSDQWFVSHRTIEQTNSMPMTAIEDEIRSGMDPALVRQEFWCDFSAANVGSVYGDLMEQLDRAGGIVDFEFPRDGVFVSLDLGISDSTAMWAWRVTGDSVDFINYYEANGKPLSHFFDKLEEWNYGLKKIWLPHDARARTLQTGASVLDQFINRYGSGLVSIGPSLSLADGIQALRWLLQKKPRLHATNCQLGAECLREYRYEYDPDTRAFSRKPMHDWTSHGADAARYVALVVKTSELLTRKHEEKREPISVPMDRSFQLDELWDANESSKGGRRI